MELNLGEEANHKPGSAAAVGDDVGVAHSSRFVEAYYDQLQKRPPRKTWDEYKKDKEDVLEKFAGGSDMAKYRKELDKAREQHLLRKQRDTGGSGSKKKKSKKEKKEKKERKEKKEKKDKKRKRDRSSSPSVTTSPKQKEGKHRHEER
mmetsp:Transcript_8693/g.26141  ORF Transcript_8693/g.26141 Transcript_8693/m.26141 type:complete len:148 (+) Transcript_8693:96-539(+)